MSPNGKNADRLILARFSDTGDRGNRDAGTLLTLHIIPFTSRYVIPISGMVIGNAMVLSSLFLSRLSSEADLRKEEIQLILSLGGTPKQAVRQILTSSMKLSMIPTLESQKTLGLVQLPGMMTGQILAGLIRYRRCAFSR